VLAFILPGLVVFTVLQRAAETTVFTIMFDKLEGIISDVLMPPLAPSEITAAYALAGAAAGLVTGLPVLTAAMLLFGMTALQPLVMLAFAVGGALMLSLTGMLVGIWAARWDHVGAFLGFVLIPLAFLSGMFAPISDLPAPLPTLMLANPIHYVIDGFRAGAIGVHRAPVWLSLTVVAATDIVLWLLCRHLLQRGWKLRA
jgi:ABC-2 type transport system permease protein